MMARWACVTGAHGTNRAGVMREMAALVRGRVAGFTQGWQTDTEGARTALELRRLGSDDVVVVGRKAPRLDGPTLCEMEFHEDAFATAARWLLEDAPGADVVFIDELSKLEAAGGGNCPAALWALARPGDTCVTLFIRADQLAGVMERLGIEEEPVALLELPAGEEQRRRFVDAISARP